MQRREIQKLFLVYAAVLLVSFSCQGSGTENQEITVCFDAEIEVSLDSSLAQWKSDSTLVLCPGTHTIHDFHLIRDLTNITIRGNSDSDTTITCHDGIGLAFFNVSRLEIENVAIIGCGMRGNATEAVESAIKQVVDTFFRIPNATNIAVILGSCQHVRLNQVTIADSAGIGLVGINVMGNSNLDDMKFDNNVYKLCNTSRKFALDPRISTSLGGGGAFFLYHNYTPGHMANPLHHGAQLSVSHSNFTGNAECSPASIVELYYPYSSALLKLGYLVGGGGGLTVMLAQSTYQVNATVEHSRFVGNHARYGSGAHVGIFNTAINFFVRFLRCVFLENGSPPDVYSPEQFSVGGSGVAIINGLVNPSSMWSVIERKNGFVVIEDSELVNNYGYEGSGLFLYSLYSSVSGLQDYNGITQVKCVNCRFRSNVGALGPAIYAREFQRQLSGLRGLSLELVDVSIVGNIVTTLEKKTFRLLLESSAAVHARSVDVILSGSCSVMHTQGTGMHGRSSTFNITDQSTLRLVNNTGEFGGGMTLLFQAYVYLQRNSTLTFQDNVGRVSGGALYVRVPDDSTYPYMDCFLYLLTIDALMSTSHCDDLKDLGIKVSFLGNRAPIGSIMFGSGLETCAWVAELRHPNHLSKARSAFEVIQDCLPGMFIFDDDVLPRGINELATAPMSLTVLNTSYSAMPGQVLDINIAAVDRLSNLVPTVVTSTVLGNQNVSSQIGKSGYYHLVENQTTTAVPLQVFGPEGDRAIVELYSIESYADIQLHILLEECSSGFTYSDETAECICDTDLTEKGIQCDTDTAALLIPDHLWIGPLKNKGIELVGDCILDYCQPGAKTIIPPDYDSQCNDGYSRTGILCGTCKEGYSVAFGTNKCLRCPNMYLLLVIAYVIGGIMLTLGISLLRISVTKGYLNAVLLYCNIINVYIDSFTPGRARHSFLPIALLNFNLGAETCFFSGMNSLARVSIQLAFPAYLFALIAIWVLLARTEQFRWLGHPRLDTVKVFGVLLILCYSSVLETCIEILGVVRMDTLPGDHLVRWVVDPTVTYFNGLHGVLGAIAVLLVIVYITIFPLLLMFPKWAYWLPYIRKLKPIFDSLYDPFTDKAKGWLGVRLALRTLPFVFYWFATFPLNVFLLVLFLVALLYCQHIVRPFKAALVNAVDNLLIANAIFLAVGAFYFDIEKHPKVMPSIFFDTLVYLAYGGFLVILGYCIYVQISKLSCWKDLYMCVCHPKRAQVYETIEERHPEHVDPTHNSVFITHSSVL